MKPLNERPLKKELTFKTAKSGGAGGQHVNKTDTRVMLRFDVEASEQLTKSEKKRIRNKLANYINSEGVLLTESDETRSQYRNKELAVNKFYELLRGALKRRKRRIRTKPTRLSKEKRLQSKKKRGEKKQTRRKDNIL